ncbi:MAG: PAS domain S-box protein [Deltaproteobacteria bacterium]|nr:PAS domain S-box protein [Deltaproteobacteria bacterium]
MTDPSRTNQELIEEISVLQQRIEELEHSEADRKRAEEALRESEAQYRLLADHMKDQVWLMDLNLKPIYISPSVEKLRGYTSEEIAQLPLDKHLTATSLRSAMEFFSIEMPKAMADPTYILTRSLELEFYRKDGSTLWVENTFSLIRDENGKPLSLLGVGRDITERKQAEAAREKSEENYRLLFETAGEGILIVQGEMIKFANPALAEILGYHPDIITTRLFSSFIHPDDRAMVVDRHVRRMLGEPMETGYDFRIISADGTERWLHIISRTLSWEGMPASLSFVMDITASKQAEKALRESEDRYRTLVESASDVVCRMDDTGHFTFINPAMIRITGYAEDEIIGKQYLTLLRPDMRDDAMKFFGRQFVKRLQNVYSEYPIITKEGHEVWLGQNTQLIVENGHVIGFQAVSRDITDRKQIEKELRDSEERYRELSIVDGLTQLYNSRHFYFQLKIELDRSNRYEQPLTLPLLDLDNFKEFNDAYGHVEGDQVLWRLGQVVKRCLRETDFAYRYGGEEFTILLPMTTGADGAVTAERIRTEFKKETFSPGPGQDVHVTVSIGLAQYKPQEDMKVFVHRVDQLMYQGKKNGKDRVCCES